MHYDGAPGLFTLSTDPKDPKIDFASPRRLTATATAVATALMEDPLRGDTGASGSAAAFGAA